jgi:glycine dehydrogenase subunit 2
LLRHYLHLAQMTLGMIGISLFGTCTMKYNAPVAELLANRPQLAELHPLQDESTLQGALAIIHNFDLILRVRDGSVHLPTWRRRRRRLHALLRDSRLLCRARRAAQRNEIVTTIQAHPCNAATAAAAGFNVVTLMLESNGYPSLDALKAAVGPHTAAVMLNNPDDMGVYNPDIVEWIRLVHEAGGLAFYDHANFNGVMGRVRARELGFDACMYMLHKTFGAPKGGGGPAVGAYGCSAELAPYLPGPVVMKSGSHYRLDHDRPQSIGKVREFWGNVPQVMKAYAWARALGAEGIREAADISVIANNYMEKRLLEIDGVSKSHPHLKQHRLEMTRMSLSDLKEKTGVGTLDVQNRMVDFGVDAYWLSHEPWVVPEPFTPEAGEMYGKEDLDYWVDVIAHIAEEARTRPDTVKGAPHNQAIAQLRGEWMEDPRRWAMTWRAYLKKHRSKSASDDRAAKS